MAANERWKGAAPSVLFALAVACSLLPPSTTQPCSSLHPRVFKGCIPSNGTSSGQFSRQKDVNSLTDCVTLCCMKSDCHITLYTIERNPQGDYDGKDSVRCYLVTCESSLQCLPVKRDLSDVKTSVVLVRPVENRSWASLLSDARINSYDDMSEPDVEANEAYSGFKQTECELGVGNCGENEECRRSHEHSRGGFCACVDGFVPNSAGDCVLSLTNHILSEIAPLRAQFPEPQAADDIDSKNVFLEGGSSLLKGPREEESRTILPSTSSKPLHQITVSAVSKVVQLPENKVKLSAYTVPSEKPGEHFSYEWTLLSKPEGEDNTGTMNNQNGVTVELSNLIEGLYTFKVGVTAPGAYGSTLVNVTVLPAKRINRVPVAVITPVSQIVKSPNSEAVLDGSTSTDDVNIVKWHWELQQGPLGYKPQLQDTPTLQLKNLTKSGNYTFKLTVTDTDGATNSTTANITVVPSRDYPPEANAGQDIIVYLPQNSVTLNGNLSLDDHGITSWEWTKSPSNQNKAVDMQNTRTPYLHLSNLELGMYTFTLKVMDGLGQFSTADVHVFVKPPTNNPPVVNAGPNLTVSLPQNWVTLDASKSTDDNKIVGWQWEEVKRPSASNPVVFSNSTGARTNVSDLTRGSYEFRITVMDETNNKASGVVSVTVNQNQNAPPKANAGGDQTIVLPVSVIMLNGSQSSDDLGVVTWEWTREPNSLAIGRILGTSNSSSILMLTDVVPGRYVFRLKVTDEQGSFSEDTISIIVKPDPHRFDLVELTLNIEGEQLTKSQEDSLRLKLTLLLKDNSVIHVRQLRQEHSSGRAQMVFYVEDKAAKSVMPGPAVVRRLKQKLEQDTGLLELSVANIQTDICQNNCSGHGVCDKANRLCLCEAFWMQNLMRKYLGDGESNCDWSILYVIVGLFVGVLLCLSVVWGTFWLCQRIFSPRQTRTRKRYAPVDPAEEDSMLPKYSQDRMFTDTDSDSDVVFESQRSSTNGTIQNGCHKKITKNGIKLGRRIKT